MNEKVKKIYDAVKMWVGIAAFILFAQDYLRNFFSIPERVEQLEKINHAQDSLIKMIRDSVTVNTQWNKEDYREMEKIKNQLK